jgi:hypothetical protein
MMFDYLDLTQKELITQVKAACKALKFIRSVTAEDTLPRRPDGSPNPKYTQWCKQMSILNTARVDIEMAGEYLRDELNTENEDKCIAWKQIEQEQTRKKKAKTRKT